MTLKEIIQIASNAYDPDGIVMQYHEDPDGEHGDGLAKFIACEIAETYEEDAETIAQLEEAHRVMLSADRQIHSVVAALKAGVPRLCVKEKLLSLSHEEKLRFLHRVTYGKAVSGREVLTMDNQLRTLVDHICDLDNTREPYSNEKEVLQAILLTYGAEEGT